MSAQPAIDWREVYAGRVRAIEALYGDTHAELLEWGRWGRERFPGRPRLMLSGIWTLPGDTDPNRDPEAAPTVRMPPFDERAIISLDVRIHRESFPSLWRKVLHSSYVRRLAEYQRPNDARVGHELFIESLSNALDFLRERR